MPELNPQQFGDYSIEYTGHEQEAGQFFGYHNVVARDAGGEQVGSLRWQTGNKSHPGEVDDVKVHGEHQRKGIATAMWSYAQSSGIRPSPKHSRHRTTAGDAWAKSVGGRRPRNQANDPL